MHMHKADVAPDGFQMTCADLNNVQKSMVYTIVWQILIANRWLVAFREDLHSGMTSVIHSLLPFSVA